MRILYLTNKPIYPLLDGGCVAMNQTAKLLMDSALEVTNLTVETQKHPFIPDAFPEKFIEKFNPQSIFIDTKVTVLGFIKSLLKNESYHLSRFYSKAFEKRVIELISTTPYDLILCESLYLLPYADAIRKHSKAKIIVRTHNVEHLIWERLARSPSFPKKIVMNYLVKQLKKEEINLLRKADTILSISKTDTAIFKRFDIQNNITTLPVFIEEVGQRVDYKSVHFHHLGAMNWQPNLEGVNELVTTIFPKIRKELPTAELHLAGSYFPNTIQTDTGNGVFVHGFVEDKLEFINTHGIQLVNLKSGSGVRIKLLESMAMGVPIVTTTLGVEGLNIACIDAILISENEDAFIKNAVEMYKNKALRKSTGEKGVTFTAEHHDFETIKKQFFEAIGHIS